MSIKKPNLNNVNQINWELTQYSVLSELHFEEHFMNRTQRFNLNWQLNPVPTTYLAELLKSPSYFTVQKMKFSIKDFLSKCNQICSFLRIWSCLLKRFLMENFIFCAVFSNFCNQEKETYSENISSRWDLTFPWPRFPWPRLFDDLNKNYAPTEFIFSKNQDCVFYCNLCFNQYSQCSKFIMTIKIDKKCSITCFKYRSLFSHGFFNEKS